MPNDLILNSLEIHHFRGIRELRINRLGRVNLLVGKNNVGKSTVLEALRLYANPGSLRILIDILSSRDEVHKRDFPRRGRGNITPIPVGAFFHDHRAIADPSKAISIGPRAGTSQSLSIEYQKRSLSYKLFNVEEVDINRIAASPELVHNAPNVIVTQDVLVFRFNTFKRILYLNHPDSQPSNLAPKVVAVTEQLADEGLSDIPQIRSQYVPSSGLPAAPQNYLWDEISFSGHQQDVMNAIRLVSPSVERVAFQEMKVHFEARMDIASESEDSRARLPRIPYIKVLGHEDPLPLRSLGDGAVRLFGISLALTNSRGGFLFVDEIENGIHYSAQIDLWRLVFQLAQRLSVQVFATTHSLDCVKAFDKVARDADEQGMLIRLAKRNGETLAGEFDEDELEIAIDGQIEVR